MTPQELFDVSGKVMLITGASGGVGRWLTEGLVTAGAHLVLATRNKEACQRFLSGLSRAASEVLVVSTSVTDPTSVARLFEATVSHFGRLDVLVNNAGTTCIKPTLEISEADYYDVTDVNLKATLLCSQAGCRVMRPRGEGRIINVGSVAGLAVKPGSQTLLYNMTKAGLVMMTKALAQEWAPYGIRVNAIAPGFLDTGLAAGFSRHAGSELDMLGMVPLARLGRATDILGAVLFLASSASDFVTGHVLVVDGGRSIL